MTSTSHAKLADELGASNSLMLLRKREVSVANLFARWGAGQT